ncbi:MAG: FemAB family XrtA/PEP-CTERM system-associated protein [Planctomycetota bacterium]
MRVRPLESSDRADWDAFVRGAERATLFHDLRWLDLVEKLGGHLPRSLLVESAEQVVGVLPLFAVKLPFWGTGLVSSPHAVYGGILAATPEAEQALIERVRQLVADEGHRYAELRQLRSVEGLPSQELYVTFIRDLPADPEQCLAMIPRKSRATARQARDRHHLRLVEGWHLLDPFYDLFVLNKRSLGSPAFSRSYFQGFFDLFPDEVVLHGVRDNGHIVAAVMSFVYRDTLMAYYSGSVKAAERLGTMNFMYWKLMEWAAARGLKKFDFGRSRRDTGAFDFKKNMGFEPQPLSYHFVLAEGEKIPTINPSNPRFDLAKTVWSRLPLPLVRWLGPKLMRYLP